MTVEVATKACTRCTKRKKLSMFGKNPRMASGHKSYCRVCSAELQRIWNKDKREAAKTAKK